MREIGTISPSAINQTSESGVALTTLDDMLLYTLLGSIFTYMYLLERGVSITIPTHVYSISE